MPTYVYETIPQNATEQPCQFEVQQKMTDEPLEKHPETGVPVRRIISGGLSPITSSKSDSSCCNSSCKLDVRVFGRIEG